ncbi:NADPH-dependent F420 reductase [Microbacterium pumilum]|uniref:NAD(P)-binding domain-containing protein n=1 Tax=Microbacterium pumilum TaxID=344165 RepID=A0ABP5DD71_9MICO
MTAGKPVIGILGAGRLGMVLARLATGAGYPVLIAGSGDPKRVALTPDMLAMGAAATSGPDAAERAGVVILALPLGRYRTIPADQLAGRLVIDATNYWWEVDGFPDEFTDPLTSSSALVRDHLPASRVVKAFNHMGYRDLEDEARPPGQAGRKAIGVAGDRADDLEVVSGIVDDLGFDPVIVGALADGIRLEPGTEPFGADVDARELRQMIDRFPDSQRGRRLAAALASRAASGSDH